MLTRFIVTACLATTINACITEEPPDTSAVQALGPAFDIDINSDGVADGKDAVDYIHAWGIGIDTYQLTDDTYNTGAKLDHRPYDWQIKTYGDPCLPVGITRQQFPPDKVPHIVDLARQLSRMPNQYLRWLGQHDFRFLITGELGKIIKRWKGTWRGQDVQLVLFWDFSGPTGRAHFGSAIGTNAPWEIVDHIAYNNTSGFVSLRRATTTEVFTGSVTADGGTMSGSTVYLGHTYDVTATADYRGGATTASGGFYRGPATQCNVDDKRDDQGNVTQFTGTWGIGLTPPAIEVMVGGVGGETTSHELGHTINYMVDSHDLGFTPAESTRLDQFFPPPGNPAAACTGCDVVGTGYTRNYAATSGLEDFADTWGYYVTFPASLDARIAEDLGVNVTKLLDKKNYLQRTIDTPDPGVAAAVHPATGHTFHFVAGNPPRYSIDAGAPQTIPNAGITRHGMSVVGDASRLWLFSVGTDGFVYQQSIDSANHFGTPRSLGIRTDLPTTPVVVTPGVIALFVISEAGGIGYRFYSSTTGSQIGSPGTITAVPTVRSVAAATLGTTTWLFAIEGDGTLDRMTLGYSGGTFNVTAGWQGVGLDAFSVAAARVGSVIRVAAVDKRIRVQVNQADATGNLSGWHYDPKYATCPGQPAIDSSGLLYVKGFDGTYKSHPIDSSTSYTLLAGF